MNHPHGPSLASNVQKSGPKHSMKHAKYRGLISFDKLSVPLDYLHYMFQHVSNNKGTNIVFVGVVLLHAKETPVINENLH